MQQPQLTGISEDCALKPVEEHQASPSKRRKESGPRLLARPVTTDVCDVMPHQEACRVPIVGSARQSVC
jgi:hypothetical protein